MSKRRLRWREALPIVVRELRVSARRRFTYRVRLIVAVVSAFVIACGAVVPIPSAHAGLLMFRITSILIAVICGGSGLLLTADALSREKREGTLGLLFLTRLGGADIVLGKLAAGALTGGSVAFAALPFLAFSLCLGGITGREFWVVSILLLFLLAYSLSLGIFISALFRSETAVSLTFAAVMTLPIVIACFTWGAIPPFWAHLNPFYPSIAFLDSYELFFSHQVAREALWRQFFLILLMLGAASIILPRFAVSRPARARELQKPTFLEKLRAANRRGIMESNPVLWISQRQNHPIMLLLLCAGLRAATGMTSATVYEREVTFVTLMAFVPKLFVLWHASGLMAAERQSGFLESLLTTPISAREILSGKVRAIKRQIAPALVFALLMQWSTSMGWWSANRQISNGATILFASMITLLIDVNTIAWVGLWQGLVARDRRRALIRSLLWGVAGPWIPIVVFYWMIFFAFEPKWMSDSVSLAAPALMAANVISFGIACFAMARLHEKFRSNATQTWSLKVAA
jgi:ABC-type transport system involved in multi-copper enzyme maturation permease subunit